MPLTKIQVENFWALLDQFSTDYSITEEDVRNVHAYLFEQPLSLLFSSRSLLTETISYLREIIVSKRFENVDELMYYYNKKAKKIDDYLDALVENSGKETNLLDEMKFDPLDTLQEGLYFEHNKIESLNFREIYSRLSTVHVNSQNQLTSIKPSPQVKKDIYSTIKQYLESKVNSNKSITVNYSLPSGERLDLVGKNYIEQFSNHRRVDFVFIMKLHGDWRKSDDIDLCESTDRKRGMVEWIMQYYNAREAPDYNGIINVVRKEKPISDSNFKYMLFEWLIYFKLIISGCCDYADKTIKEVFVRDNLFPLFNDQDIIYYSGHGFQGSVYRLFESKLSGKKWSILKRPHRLFWLTSDNPGFMINIGELHAGRKEMLPSHSLAEIRTDTVLYYPLSKDYCLRIEPTALSSDHLLEGAPIEFEQSSEVELNFVNSLTVSTQREMVIGSQKKLLKQYKQTYMAKNGKIGDGHRDGQVKERSQTFNPKTETWVKRDTSTGRFIDGKADDKPFKGVRKEK